MIVDVVQRWTGGRATYRPAREVNPPCVNPAHLFLGTNADNVHDMLAKGRARGIYGPRVSGSLVWGADPGRHARGARCGSARLTEAAVISLRARHAAGESQCALAAELGVHRETVGRVIRGQTWSHVAALRAQLAALAEVSRAFVVAWDDGAEGPQDAAEAALRAALTDLPAAGREWEERVRESGRKGFADIQADRDRCERLMLRIHDALGLHREEHEDTLTDERAAAVLAALATERARADAMEAALVEVREAVATLDRLPWTWPAAVFAEVGSGDNGLRVLDEVHAAWARVMAATRIEREGGGR